MYGVLRSRSSSTNNSNQPLLQHGSSLISSSEDDAPSKSASDDVPKWTFNDPNLLPDTPIATAITLMGPPKQYFGDSANDRYAYMLYEAIALLDKHCFHTDIPILRQSNMIASSSDTTTTASCLSPRKSQQQRLTRQHHRQQIPGILGFLLNDMTADRKIAVLDYGNRVVAQLGFVTYKQPWLTVECSTPSSSSTPSSPGSSSSSTAATTTMSLQKVVHLLQQVLSKRFFLVEVPHETRARSICVTNQASVVGNLTPDKYCVCSSDEKSQELENVIVKMTSGLAVPTIENDEGIMQQKQRPQLVTKFVFSRNDGTVLARALWSFVGNETLGTAPGPAMEVFETTSAFDAGRTSSSSCTFFLSTMEDALIHVFAPLVAFRIRICRRGVDNKALAPAAAKWLSERGYTETKRDGTDLCKAFVMF